MADSTTALTDSPIDFSTAVAYALQPVMRRLILLYVAGAVLLPFGLELFLTAGDFHRTVLTLVEWAIGLSVTILGAILLFAGLVGAAVKIITDANRLAQE